MSNYWDDDCDDVTYIIGPTFPNYSTIAGYTLELREFFDQYYTTGMTTSTLIEAGRTHLFDFTYPLYSPSAKTQFETGIIRQFFFREIGFANFDVFKFKLENWLVLNMPYYNKMYQSIVMENQNDPLVNSHLTETSTRTINKTKTIEHDTTKTIGLTSTIHNTETDTENHFNRDIVSNTPDTRLNLTTADDGTGMHPVIEYASQINEQKSIDVDSNIIDGTTTANTTDAITGTDTITDLDIETFTNTTQGKIGIHSYAKMLKDYRENILNVDKLVYKDMQELFMLLY